VAVAIRFDQGDTGTVGRSRSDLALSSAVTVAAVTATGTPVFSMLDRPEGSTAVLSGAGATRTFTPDVAGGYRVRIVDDNSETTHIASVRTAVRGIDIPAHNEDASADANEVDTDPGDWVERSETNEGGSNKGYHPKIEEALRLLDDSMEIGLNAESLGSDTTSGTTPVTKASLVIPAEDGTWEIQAHAAISHSNSTGNPNFWLENTTDVAELGRRFVFEPEDASNDIYSPMLHRRFTNTAVAGAKTIAARYAVNPASGTMTISDVYMTARKVA